MITSRILGGECVLCFGPQRTPLTFKTHNSFGWTPKFTASVGAAHFHTHEIIPSCSGSRSNLLPISFHFKIKLLLMLTKSRRTQPSSLVTVLQAAKRKKNMNDAENWPRLSISSFPAPLCVPKILRRTCCSQAGVPDSSDPAGGNV